MFRIRRIYDNTVAVNREALAQVQEILRGQFSLLPPQEIEKLPELLTNPLKHQFRSMVFVAEGSRRAVKGFALLCHAPDLDFCYLDYIASAVGMTGRGIGGALYQRVRQEARRLNSVGIFFECLPDDPALSPFPDILKQNIARLRFYEQFGAFPIAGTRYETPLKPDDDNPPYLVFDDVGHGRPLRRDHAKAIVRAMLVRKYGAKCPPAYVDMVVESFRDDPVRLRAPRYVNQRAEPRAVDPIAPDTRIGLVVTDQHAIHHVHDRGYVESPVRIGSIKRELERLDRFVVVEPRRYPDRHIRAVHAPSFVDYVRRVCEGLDDKTSIYPYVFPIRNAARPPLDLPTRAGYYCIDTFTPLNRQAYVAAKRAVDCALTAADHILAGNRLAYALVRPPGHHAESRVFGGFCYFNSAAIVAHYLSSHGKVAILDLDYHHGNGQQEIFYQRADVLTVSIHGHPRFAYPYFSGFEEERGAGAGLGTNVNIPLPETITAETYRAALEQAIRRIRRFSPHFLIVPLGLDTAKNDPTGSWDLGARDFYENGLSVGALALPTVVTQEGGYDNRVLGRNARRFFEGLWDGAFGAPTRPARPEAAVPTGRPSHR